MDEDQVQSEISEAEKRRNRRRQRILANQESRMQRILGSESAVESKKDEKSTDHLIDGVCEGGADEDVDVDADFNVARKRATSSTSSHNQPTKLERRVLKTKSTKTKEPSSNSNTAFAQIPSTSSSSSGGVLADFPDEDVYENDEGRGRSRANLGVRFGVVAEDGSTLHPKIPAWVGRVFVCFLGVILSVFNGKYFMVTFFSWEVAFLGINGLPAAPPPGIFIALVALMGLKEPHLHRLKFLTQLLNCLITDLSLFVISALIPRVILHSPLTNY